MQVLALERSVHSLGSEPTAPFCPVVEISQEYVEKNNRVDLSISPARKIPISGRSNIESSYDQGG